jgi:hypothetical protein
MKRGVPLSETHPEIAMEAFGWDPSSVSRGSNKRLFWRCRNNHQYEATPHSRTGQGSGCPYCSNQKVLSGYNDLLTNHPDIAAEALNWDPAKVISGSEKKRKWKCQFGHVYETTPATRTYRNTGCSVCSNRAIVVGQNDLGTTYPEIAMEADGWDASSVVAGTAKRMPWICPEGHRYVALISNRTRLGTGCSICSNKKVLAGFNDIATTFPEVASEAYGWDPKHVIAGNHHKRKWKCPESHIYEASTHSRTTKKSGCSICSNTQVLSGYNDLATSHPEIASEADGWDPSKVITGSETKRKWKCPLLHSYISTPALRSSQNQGCPICIGKKVLPGFNDLATTLPEIASQAAGWDPRTVTSGSNAKKRWRCEFGHEWITSPNSRKKSGCPTCTVTGFNPNADSWLYFMRNERLGYLQIGITNQPKIRTHLHEKSGWELLDIRGPMDGHICQQWETAILKMLRNSGASMGPRKDSLQKKSLSDYEILYGTEMWIEETFNVDSIKSLMRLTNEFESDKKT